MAASVDELIANLVNEVDSKHVDVEPALRRFMVRSLTGLSRIRVLWSEGSFSFSTVANQEAYGAVDSGFPVDAMSYDTVYVEDGNRRRPLDLISMTELRASAVTTPLTDLYPTAYALHQRKMFLKPIPSGVVSIKGDYHKDARRDEATGLLIAANDTTAVNDWFREGEDLLASRILMEFYASAYGNSPDNASRYDSLYSIAHGEAKAQYHLNRSQAMQSPWSLGGELCFEDGWY